MIKQDLFQSRKPRQSLFAQGREIAANATKGVGSRETAKAARNLLLHFDHAQISLSQIIVKGHRQVVHEGQDSVLLLAQAIQQVAGSTLFAPSFGPQRWTQLGRLSGLSLNRTPG